jgi:hypothetical protein
MLVRLVVTQTHACAEEQTDSVLGRLALTRSLGNWFEQKVIESGCKEGAGPAIAPFEKEGLPFQKPGETTQFHNRYVHADACHMARV